MPTILKIEHGTIDGRGRFHKSKSPTGARSLLGTPRSTRSTRSVSRIRTANGKGKGRGKANPAAQLKALLGEGKWTQAKVRPIKGGKVQVLLTQRENPKGKAAPVIDFYYTGDIEVGTGGPGYRWVAGYQSKSENGNWYYPPMTYRDSQKWAKSQGAKAKFHGDRRYQTH